MSDCTFCDILNGDIEGEIVAHDPARRLAIVANIHPEGAVHWLALPAEHFDSTEALEKSSRERFMELFDFALEQARQKAGEYPALSHGFTLKLHFGAFESLPHPKVHIVSIE